MEIMECLLSNIDEKWIDRIENCSWGAAKLLAELLRDQNRLEDALGYNGEIFILKHYDELIGFATLTQRECIFDDNLYPWAGFVFIRHEYRGHRYSERVLEYVCQKAKECGHKNIYIATEHAGKLYEKYGFIYKEDREDVFGAVNQVYYKKLI